MADAELDRMLGLRPPQPADVHAIAAIAGDVRTSRHIPTGALSVEASRNLVEGWMDDWSRHAVGYWVIEEPLTAGVIGWGGARFISVDDTALLNMAYRVAWSHWGQGIGTWVACRARSVASASFPETPVIARIAPDNRASMRTAARAGLSCVGRDRQTWPVYADRRLAPATLQALPPA